MRRFESRSAAGSARGRSGGATDPERPLHDRMAPLVLVAAVALLSVPAHAQPRAVRASALDPAALVAWDLEVRGLERAGTLELRRATPDTLLEGRLHERLQQRHRGVPVWGGEIVRQSRGGETLSLFGLYHEGVEVETAPDLGGESAREILAGRHGVSPGPRFAPRLVVLPLDAGGYALAWHVRVFTGADLVVGFVDARSGEVLLEYSGLHTQSSVGLGKGVYGDEKKLSGSSGGGGFVARDLLRPPAIETHDMKGDLNRTIGFLNGFFDLGESDLAADADNTWEDGPVVDAHVYAGYFYDYLFERFGRRGLDDRDITITGLVHPVRRDDVFLYDFDIIGAFYVNAFYLTSGIMVYGEGLPTGLFLGGREWNYFSAGFDVVAHELTHGVTEYTSDLIYRNESGALNEAFSDILATGAEFFIQPAGPGRMQADYLLGEDVSTPAIRSMSDPIAFGDPDHYSIRFTGPQDNGGVHINSGIANHAFYLAVEGGTNRVSGLTVEGVGGANRADVERAFYRGFALMLPPGAGFSTAREATVLAAVELFGTASPEAVAIDQAWAAVGVE